MIYDGVGFGFGFVVMFDLMIVQLIGSEGEYFWGGVVSIIFWIDLKEDFIVVFLMQLMLFGIFNFCGQLKLIVYFVLF